MKMSRVTRKPRYRINAECQACHKVKKLLIGIGMSCVGEPFVQYMCLGCRLAINVKDAPTWLGGYDFVDVHSPIREVRCSAQLREAVH